jgi:hypothetical protein
MEDITIMDGTGDGVVADAEAGATGDGAPTFTASDLLVVSNTGTGLNVDTGVYTGTNWSIQFPWLFGNGTPSIPTVADSHITSEQTADPLLESCKVYLPAVSPTKTGGSGGTENGATVYYRLQGGTQTSTPLWTAVTNRFPCGPVVTGVNDSAGNSCMSVDERLNVRRNGCPDLLAGPPVLGMGGRAFVGHEYRGVAVLPW